MADNESIEVGGEVAQSPVQQEKLLSQSEVNTIVGREKQQAADKARREAEQQYLVQLQELQKQKELQTMNQQHETQMQSNATQSREVDADQIYQQVQERFNQEMQQKQLETEMSNVANNYLTKMGEGKGRYEDFEDVTKDFDPTAFPTLIYLVAGMDNAADVIYELAKNPSKLVTIDTLSQRAPKQAQAELLKLSASIADNQKSASDANNQGVNEPLQRMQPSRLSGSNGDMSIRDLRSQPWLRG